MRSLVLYALICCLAFGLKLNNAHFEDALSLSHFAANFKEQIAKKLMDDKQVRDLVMKKANESELQKVIMSKMIALVKSDNGLLKELSDEIWANSTDEALKNLTDAEKLSLVNVSLSHPEAFDGTLHKEKFLEWIKDDSSLKSIAEKLKLIVPVAAVTQHLAGGGLVQKKIATAILQDPEVVRLIKEGKVNSQQFKSTVLQRTLYVVRTDPTIQADFAKKVFSKDRFGRTLTEDEQTRLLVFMLNRPEVLKNSDGEPSLKDKATIMEAAKYDLKDIYAKWQVYLSKTGGSSGIPNRSSNGGSAFVR